MDFNTIIKNKIGEFLNTLGFSIIEDSKNSVSFKSEKITIRFSYYTYGYEYYYFIKLNNEEIDYENFIVEGYLQIDEELLLSNISQETKIENWLDRTMNYFRKFQSTLLKGDKDFYVGLNQYFEKITEIYNKKISE